MNNYTKALIEHIEHSETLDISEIPLLKDISIDDHVYEFCELKEVINYVQFMK